MTKKLGMTLGISALVAALGLVTFNRSGGTPAGTPGALTAESGTPAPTAPIASGAPKSEPAKVDAKLAAQIQKMAPKEIEARMKEIDSEYFTETMRDRLNSGAVSAEERAKAKEAFAEKNALFARWAEIKIAKYDAAVKEIERTHAATLERVKGEFNEAN